MPANIVSGNDSYSLLGDMHDDIERAMCLNGDTSMLQARMADYLANMGWRLCAGRGLCECKGRGLCECVNRGLYTDRRQWGKLGPNKGTLENQ